MTVDIVIPAAERPVRQLPQSTAAALTVLVATSAGYYVGAQIGFELRFPNSPHSILWPPTAILLAAFMLLPVKLWAWCAIAVLPAHIAISLPAGVPLIPMFGFYVTNTSQAGASANRRDWIVEWRVCVQRRRRFAECHISRSIFNQHCSATDHLDASPDKHIRRRRKFQRIYCCRP